MSRELHLDWETHSHADLRKVGGYRYAEDPSTEILLAAYYLHEEGDSWLPSEDEVDQWSPAEGEAMPSALRAALMDHEVTIVAWNASFERAILAACLPEFDIPVFRFRCAMVNAMSVGFPGKLDQAGPAIGISPELFKQEGGSRLISKFCKPRKPSKKNPATRWTPASAPEDWRLFKRYNRQDIVAEVAVWQKLKAWRLLPEEQRLWEIDQRMNDRGIQVDVELAEAAHRMGLMHRERLVAKAKAITGLDNPNSVKQLVEWLNSQKDFDPEEENEEVTNLRKKTVEQILGRGGLDDVVRQVLELRQQIAKASLKKYDTILRAVCRDGRIRGTMQFGGANRTMRWAGRLLQVQNLPQGCIEDLDLLTVVRELVRSNEYEALIDMFGESQIPEVLATLIRTCLIAAAGKRLIVADLSAIEARVTAWFAKCEWRMEVFRTHGKIYEASASTAFGVPLHEFLDYKRKTGKHHPLRKKGKVIELACIAEGQPVLTDVGLVPIERVTTAMKVWDGDSFVAHQGVVFKGTKEVIEYDGLIATKDHVVWTDQGEQEFGNAAQSGAHLVQSGAGWRPIRVGRDHQPGTEIHEGMVAPVCPNEMHGMWSCSLAQLCQPETREIKRVSVVLPACGYSELAHQEGPGDEKSVRAADESGVCELRRPGNPLRVCLGGGSYTVDKGQPRPEEREGSGPDKQQRPLCSGESAICHAIRKHEESAPVEANAGRRDLGEDIEPSWIQRDVSLPGSRVSEGSDHRPSLQGCSGQTKKLAGHQRAARLARVFDLVNAGPRHRYTVSGKLVHNCGYQGGVNAMITMGALEQGLTVDELPPMVDAWRKASPEIAGTKNADGYWEGGLWRDVENAVKKCLRTKARQEVAGCVFRIAGGNLVITLPSGRHMHYVRARLHKEGKRWEIRYWGTDQKTKRWGEINTYGGKLVENIVQAFSRDILREILFALDDKGYHPIMLVHDEGVFEEDEDFGSLGEVLDAMGTTPKYAPGLPLKGDGFESSFYMK